MQEDLRALLDEIIEAGKSQGKDQKRIAEDALVGNVTLSRSKSSEDIKFSTLQRLAKSVGLRLALVPNTPLASRIDKGELFE